MRIRQRTMRFDGVAVILLLVALVPCLFAYGSWAEHQRRSYILQQGQSVLAAVTKSDDDGYRKLCKVEYVVQWEGDAYNGSIIDCATMQRYPKGSFIPVRLDPRDPGNSLAVGEDTWPPMSIVPVLLAPPLLLLASIFIYSFIRRRPSRRRKAHIEGR